MIQDVEIRPATLAEAYNFFGRSLSTSAWCWIACYKGEPVVLAGVALDKGIATAFMDSKPHSAPKATVWRGAVAIFRRMKKLGLPLVAIANRDFPNAGRFLTKLGFNYVSTSKHGEVFVCRELN